MLFMEGYGVGQGLSCHTLSCRDIQTNKISLVPCLATVIIVIVVVVEMQYFVLEEVAEDVVVLVESTVVSQRCFAKRSVAIRQQDDVFIRVLINESISIRICVLIVIRESGFAKRSVTIRQQHNMNENI